MEDRLIGSRRKNLEDLTALGLEAWPRRFDRLVTVAEAASTWRETSADDLESSRPTTRLAGRLTGIRAFGKAAFIVLSDGLDTIQVHVKSNFIEAPGFEIYKLLDIGDFAGVEGRLFRTRSGELTIEARQLVFLGKALRPLPEKWHGLKDPETRYRQRYIDLIVNPEVRGVFESRSKIIRETRRFLDGAGYLEVETPMMQTIAGGATARPFTTHHNALDLDLYLRIAPELHLKRLVVGGFEKVYEINRNFRNEGISIRHNPEFTMLEFYEAYADYEDLMEFTEALLATVAERSIGTTSFTYQGRPIDLGTRPYQRLRMRDAVREALAERRDLGFDPAELENPEAVARFTDQLHPAANNGYRGQPWGKRLAMLFEEFVEPHLWGPTFVYEYPVEVSPLSKRSPSDPRFVERFEMYLGGFEVVNAFSELNDPDDQRGRFQEQVAARAGGDDEAHPMDEDYAEALEHGLPPTAGAGLGIDRLVMVLTDSRSIRDVILFPLMRPRA